MKLSDFCRQTVQLERFKMLPDGTTFCNQFVQLVAHEAKCNELDGMTANQICRHVVTHPQSWKILEPELAQQAANNGFLILACWENPSADGHGHVCIVVEGRLCWSEKHKKDLPIVANVGRDNFHGRLASYAFSPATPPFFAAWIGQPA